MKISYLNRSGLNFSEWFVCKQEFSARMTVLSNIFSGTCDSSLNCFSVNLSTMKL